MYPALFLCMQLAGPAAPAAVPLQTPAPVTVRAEDAGGTNDQAQEGNAVHNPLRKAPRIAGYTLGQHRPITTKP